MTSSTVRRGAPLAAGVAVLVVLAGSAFLLDGDDTGPGSTGSEPPPLRIGAASIAADGAAAKGQVTVTGDLPDGPGSARVHRFSPIDPDVVSTLAGSLGVDPSAVRTGAQQWQFVRAGASGCLDQPLGGPPDEPVSSCVVPPEKRRPAAAAPPSAADTIATARPVLAAVGLDVDDAVVSTAENFGLELETRRVWIDPAVGDAPTTGFGTTVTVDDRGVLSASGWLGDVQPGDRYPVLSAQVAVDQLAAMPMPLLACAESTTPVPPGPICGGPLEVTGAAFGFSLQWEGERPLLVPSWLFDLKGGVQPLAVVAVDPSYLLDPPAPSVDEPSGGATGGGVPGSSGSADPGEPVAPDVEPTAATSRFDSVSPVDDGAGLLVTFYGGVDTCYTYLVAAEESAKEVALRLVEDRTSGEVCIDVAQQYERTVELERPLGDRRVVDAETGTALYPVRSDG